AALEIAQRRAVAVDARVVALLEQALATEEARAAGRVEGAEDTVALRDAGDRVANRLDRPDELVADREAGLDLHAAVVDVQVRAADPGRLDADDRVVGRGQLGVGALLDRDAARLLEGDGAHEGGTVEAVRQSRSVGTSSLKRGKTTSPQSELD